LLPYYILAGKITPYFLILQIKSVTFAGRRAFLDAKRLDILNIFRIFVADYWYAGVLPQNTIET
jgi:hypothetical protein